MAVSERSMIAGVFTSEEQARRAIDELRRSGFSDDQIRVAGRGVSSPGGFLENLKTLFVGQGASGVHTAHDFMRLGVPEHEARYFQDEIQAGRTIVLVTAPGGQQEAIEILRHNGAYDITAHLRSYDPNAPQGAYTNVQQGQYASPNVPPGQYPPGSQPGQYNPNVPPGQYPPSGQPGQYNPNVPPGQYPNPNTAPGQAPGQYNPNVPPGQYGNQPPPPDFRRERNP
jgi:hypothetical protein